MFSPNIVCYKRVLVYYSNSCGLYLYLENGVGSRRGLVNGGGFTGPALVAHAEQSHDFQRGGCFDLQQPHHDHGPRGVLPQLQDTTGGIQQVTDHLIVDLGGGRGRGREREVPSNISDLFSHAVSLISCHIHYNGIKIFHWLVHGLRRRSH